MTESKPDRDGNSLVDDWNFSTETVFRISKLLEDFRHEFSRTKPALLARLATKDENSRLQVDFVRKVFTSLDQERVISQASKVNPDPFGSQVAPLCFEFTGSSFVDNFRKAKDDHTREDLLNKAFKRTTDLLFDHGPCSKRTALWIQLTTLFRCAYKDTTLIGVLEQLNQCISDLEFKAAPTRDEKFQLLSLFFVFYSRLNIAGEAVATVSSVHFSEASEFRHGRENCYGYLIESSPAEEIDHALLRIDRTGCAWPIRKNFLGAPRAKSLYFPDSEVQVNSNAHEDVRNDFFSGAYKVFNPDNAPEGDTIVTRIPKGRVYDLVIPVYEIDDLSRDSDENNHVISGPFLGWFFIRLDDDALTKILAPSKKSNWKKKWDLLCLKKGKLANRLTEEIQQLRIALNRFSELYLLGEMEWATEQPWLDATDAARFTKEHYYNCDGWMQDVELMLSNEILTELLDNGYSVFCQLKDGILHAIPNTIQENCISHIVVDVGRSFGIDEKGIGRTIPLVFKRRITTSVPMATADREFYRLWVTDNIRRFYNMARMLEVERRTGNIAGSLEQAEAVNVAISHEFKKIIPLIPHAPAFVLPHITQWLLAYSLPGLAHIDELHDGHRLPDAIKIHEGANYHQWMDGLVRMAAEIEALSRPGESRHLPDSEQQWAKNVENIQGCFSISESLKYRIVPSLFVVRCLYGAAVLCVLRNTIKATFVHRPFRNQVTKAAAYGQMVFQANEKISIYEESGLKNVWSDCALVISNCALVEETKARRNGGTAGAVNFYFSSIQKSLGLTRPFTYSTPRDSENGVHLSRLPLIEAESKSP